VSSDSLPRPSSADLEYARIWCDCTARVIESLHGSPVTGTAKASSSESETLPEDQSLWVHFKVTGRLEGDHAFQLAKSDAVRLAQLLMSEPADPSVAYNDTHADAINEIFRQFAGLAATSCKSKYGGEVQFQLDSLTRPEWTPASRVIGIFAAPQLAPIQWILSVSRELYAVIGVLEVAAEAKTPPPVQRTPSAAGSSPAPPPSGPAPPALESPTARVADPAPVRVAPAESIATPSNLNLLLDIELDASLRFGQSEMILREILELRPGSVVELNRQIQEPAELLVAGRVIARGEVVIVDGSYGLRITDIAQPEQRLKSLQT
jgi:flagellar motor switch protein FliN